MEAAILVPSFAEKAFKVLRNTLANSLDLSDILRKSFSIDILEAISIQM
jgi:hypothetical protein